MADKPDKNQDEYEKIIAEKDEQIRLLTRSVEYLSRELNERGVTKSDTFAENITQSFMLGLATSIVTTVLTSDSQIGAIAFLVSIIFLFAYLLWTRSMKRRSESQETQIAEYQIANAENRLSKKRKNDDDQTSDQAQLENVLNRLQEQASEDDTIHMATIRDILRDYDASTGDD